MIVQLLLCLLSVVEHGVYFDFINQVTLLNIMADDQHFSHVGYVNFMLSGIGHQIHKSN